MVSHQQSSKTASRTLSGVKSTPSVRNAGFSPTQPRGECNQNPAHHGAIGQRERAFSAMSTFLSGVMAISASQFIGAPLKLVDPKFYEAYMARTKESFAVLVTTITQWWAPTLVRVSGDDSIKGQLFQMPDGSLKCNFPHRMVCMANHQLYTDWMYLWWVAYTNKMHGHVYIILKESLKQLPIIGWGAQFYNFIFLSRKWETDRFRFCQALSHLKNPDSPMWLLIFPEGTNLSATTRVKSAAWSQTTGIPDMKHQLLPRTTGLRFCMQELRHTTNWLYDCTIAYEGVPKGKYGQDVFTLRSSLFEGRPPDSVNMFWRRYKISEIPLDNEEAFSRWLVNRWREKDYMLEYFDKFGAFPAYQSTEALAAAKGHGRIQHAKTICTQVKAGGWDEFLEIFGPLSSTAEALSNVDLTEPLKMQAIIDSLLRIDPRRQPISTTGQEGVKRALQAANEKRPLPKPVLTQLTKDTPRSQADMKRALGQSNVASLAQKASRAPGPKKALFPDTEIQMQAAKGGVEAKRQINQSLQQHSRPPVKEVKSRRKV